METGTLLLAALITVVGVFIVICRSLRTLSDRVDSAWSKTDGLIDRWCDILSDLLKGIRDYTRTHQDILRQITEARILMDHSENREGKIDAYDKLNHAIRSFFKLSGKYPELKENKRFLSLQEKLNSIETEINDSIRLYNKNALMLNDKTRIFPFSRAAHVLKISRIRLIGIKAEDKD